MRGSVKRASLVLLYGVFLYLMLGAAATTSEVSASSDDDASGVSTDDDSSSSRDDDIYGAASDDGSSSSSGDDIYGATYEVSSSSDDDIYGTTASDDGPSSSDDDTSGTVASTDDGSSSSRDDDIYGTSASDDGSSSSADDIYDATTDEVPATYDLSVSGSDPTYGDTYEVPASGGGDTSGTTDSTTYIVSASPSAGDGTYTIDQAMSLAAPGDTVSLLDGTYDEAIVSKNNGKEGSPITVEGGRGAIINGGFSSKNVRITHSFITLKGFSVQGKMDNSGQENSYIVKCVYVEGPLEGFVMDGLSVENCGTECVRLKRFVVNSEITDNDIENCGVYDFQFSSSDENGEGIYIGTSKNQWGGVIDDCNSNLVKGNRINTNGNECVDIKEGSEGNVVEYNTCENQLDPDSGCYDSRGDYNTFRYNKGSNCKGAGVRLGGAEVDGHQYGVRNSVHDNSFSNVGQGALRVMCSGQDEICGNSCGGGACLPLTGHAYASYAGLWDKIC